MDNAADGNDDDLNNIYEKRYRLQGKRSGDNDEFDLYKRYRLQFGKRDSSENDLEKRYRLQGKRYRLYGLN